jgi:hypothetical protein
MKRFVFLFCWIVFVIGFALLIQSSPEFANKVSPGFAEELDATNRTASIIAFVLLFPVGWFLGELFRKFAHPDFVLASGAADLAKQRLFWIVGPQCIGAFVAAFASYYIGTMFKQDTKLLPLAAAPAPQPAANPITPQPDAPQRAANSTAPTPQNLTVESAQQEAMRRHPELGVGGSPLNLEFVSRFKSYKKERPYFFNNPSWPIRLADECALALKHK